MQRGAEPYGSGAALVFDTSAWNRRTELSVMPRWAITRDTGLLAVCPVVALELLAAARDQGAFDDLDRALRALRQAPVTRAACEHALSASRELAGERRLPAADYLIAAAAAERGFSVLHYDRHFDALCRVLGIESVLLAPYGALD
jgi:predicted nucleic acid-binding protein